MTELTDELLADAGERMTKSVEATRGEFASVRTGRASPALLDRIVVDYYGAATPLKQLATINVPEARLLTVQPYDQASIKAIEKAIIHIAEEGRVAIRNIRRDVMHDLRELKESGDAGADDEHRAEVELQKLTDGRIADLEAALKAKEAEILEV